MATAREGHVGAQAALLDEYLRTELPALEARVTRRSNAQTAAIRVRLTGTAAARLAPARQVAVDILVSVCGQLEAPGGDPAVRGQVLVK